MGVCTRSDANVRRSACHPRPGQGGLRESQPMPVDARRRDQARESVESYQDEQ